MAQPVMAGENEEGSELLLVETGGGGDREPATWRLNFDGFKPPEEHKEKAPRGLQDCLGVLGSGNVVAEYYQQQVEMLEGFNEMDTLTDRGFLPGMSKEEREKIAKSETFAIRISNAANMVLFAAKVYASIRSGSLAIIASTLDSLLDLLSGFILWFTAFSMQTPNPYQYPIGKRRMQPPGILVFASVMATLGLQIILESVRSLISDDNGFHLTREQETWVVDIMLSVTVVKLFLMICLPFGARRAVILLPSVESSRDESSANVPGSKKSSVAVSDSDYLKRDTTETSKINSDNARGNASMKSASI